MTDRSTSLFAAHIVGARTLLGMSQMDLALASGVSHYAVACMEKTAGAIEPGRDAERVLSLLESRGIVMGASKSTISVSVTTTKHASEMRV